MALHSRYMPILARYDSAGTILFASEPKNLLGLTDRMMPFPPGHYYKDGRFVCYRDIARVDRFCYDGLEELCRSIREKLIAGVSRSTGAGCRWDPGRR